MSRDVRVDGARVGEVGPAGALTRRSGEPALDAGGGALLPGLHDHHIHLMALAAAGYSARCGPPAVHDHEGLARALAQAPVRAGWIRGVAYHESVTGPLDRTVLDAIRGDVPVRVQHRSGACWSLNSAALVRIGPLPEGGDGVERSRSGEPTGRLFGLDAWLRSRLGADSPPDLGPVGAALARLGVTGVTDATVTNDADALASFEAAARGDALPQRLHVMGTLALPAPISPRVTRAAHKIVLTERDLPHPEALADRLRAAHELGRTVAVHCTTRVELVLACAAFAIAGGGRGDRIEHASVAPPEAVDLLAELGLTVVTQPNFVAERGDAYRRDVAADDQPWLYRAAGLCDAGVAVGGGTDAPFGDSDPWRAIRAAVERVDPDGQAFGADEALSPERALALFTSPPIAPGDPPRRIETGADADLVLLDRPWRAARTRLTSDFVRATWCGGVLVHDAT